MPNYHNLFCCCRCTLPPRHVVTGRDGPTRVACADQSGSSLHSVQTDVTHFGDHRGHVEQVESMPLLSAAVNGNKFSLEQILDCNWVGSVDVVDKLGRTPLMYCCLGDYSECAELLIKCGADVNMKDLLGRTPLLWAAHKGNFSCLKLLLSRGADWKEKDSDGQTSLHLCISHRCSKCSTHLFRYIPPGAVDDQDVNKRTAMHTAASFGNVDQVRLLIKKNSNVGIPDIEGKTPLHCAAASKDPHAVECVQYILETSPSVINWQDYEGCTALHLAVAGGNEAVVLSLISHESCDINALDNVFRTPLHWAAVFGHSSVVAILLDSKADASSSDSVGAMPLHYAVLNNFAETVEVFLSCPYVKDETDNEGHSAFLWAASSGADESICCFVKHGIDLMQVDKQGATAVHVAASAGHSSTVQLLLKSEAATLIDSKDLMKRTPLSHACEMGHVKVIEVLIANGADVSDAQDQDGLSLLHWAAIGGHADVCQLLINAGMDVDNRDIVGRTALHFAAFGGYINCMLVLLENKADCSSQDKEGVTSLHWACGKGHMDAVKLLIQYSASINTMEYTEDHYTPLDYALMGEYFEVCQFLIEHGAVSITGIQDVAAVKIQAWFRGIRVRRTFVERKKLLMKHEQLRKDAAKKRIVDDSIGLRDKSTALVKFTVTESGSDCTVTPTFVN